MGKLNKKDLVDLASEKGHLTKVESREIIDELLRAIEEALLEGNEVNLSNFGVLVPITRKTRVGTDPKKHTKITIEKTRTISFRVAKAFKEKLNG
jgi:nucleoid DNA-binding protein